MARRLNLPRVGISLGCPSGIGAEITAKALARPEVLRALTPIVFGDAAFQHLFARTTQFVALSRLNAAQRRPGKPSAAGARASLLYLDTLIDWAKQKQVDALCTAPLSKEEITQAGVFFMGHTERLAEAFSVNVLMLMDGPKLKVALATNHLPLAQVPKALTVDRLTQQLQLLSTGLTPLLQKKPLLAVCGLNPHAGEGGLLGREEIDIIQPAIRRARALKVKVHGPFPADGLLSQYASFPYDAVLAMFHDQALSVVKALDFRHTVNVTLGLPVPRTSPDHGVAYGLAGKNCADDIPMVSALLKAAQLASTSTKLRHDTPPRASKVRVVKRLSRK